MWNNYRNHPELAPPEFWYPPINPYTGETPHGYKPERSQGDELPDLVNLDQMAAIVSTSKRTLERHKTDGDLPDPVVEGGGGKSALYDWKIVRPWLMATFKYPSLPERFPRIKAVR